MGKSGSRRSKYDEDQNRDYSEFDDDTFIVCPYCEGKGVGPKKDEDPCPECDGLGVVYE